MEVYELFSWMSRTSKYSPHFWGYYQRSCLKKIKEKEEGKEKDKEKKKKRKKEKEK